MKCNTTFFVAVLLAMVCSGGNAQDRLPVRPYEPILWASSDPVELPVEWYSTMYDSTALLDGSDGYNVLQVLFGDKDQTIVVEDKIISLISRVPGVSDGTYLQALDLASGDLLWRTVLAVTDGEQEWTSLLAREQHGVVEVVGVQRFRERGMLDFFPIILSADTCKIRYYEVDVETGAVIVDQVADDNLAYPLLYRLSNVALYASQFLWVEDSLHYYEYNKFMPNQVLTAELGLDGVASAEDTLAHGMFSTSFDLHPWGVDELLMFDQVPDSIYIVEANYDLRRVGRRVPIPLNDSASFVYFSELPDGSLVIQDQYLEEFQWHLFDGDLVYEMTVNLPIGADGQVFKYGGETYLLATIPNLEDTGLDLYRATTDSLVHLHRWTTEDDRFYVPLEVRALGDRLLVLGQEGALFLEDGVLRTDTDAKAYSLLAIDLSELGLLTSVETTTSPSHGSMAVYPNPAGGNEVTVELSEPSMVQIYQSDGALVASSTSVSAVHRLSVDGLRSGLYIVRSGNGLSKQLIIAE